MRGPIAFIILFAAAHSAIAAEAPKAGKAEQVAVEGWGRDPFQEMGREETAHAGDLGLTGILFRGGKKIAILNSVFVREGESIDGVEVLRIEKDRVLLKKDGKEFTLRMGQHEQTPAAKESEDEAPQV